MALLAWTYQSKDHHLNAHCCACQKCVLCDRLIKSHSDQRLASYQRRGWNQDVELRVEAIVAETESRQGSRVYLIKWKVGLLQPASAPVATV